MKDRGINRLALTGWLPKALLFLAGILAVPAQPGQASALYDMTRLLNEPHPFAAPAYTAPPPLPPVSPPARAQAPRPLPAVPPAKSRPRASAKAPAPGGVWRFEFENEDRSVVGPIFDPIFDELFQTSDSTGHLTWGWRVSYTPNAAPKWGENLGGALFWPQGKWASRASYALQQSAYTPNSINADNGTPDRPYAGYLLANVRINYEQPFRGSRQFIDHLGLGLGLVGPASGAEVVHRAAHSVIGRSSRGWDEIKSEPVMVAQYETGARWVWGAGDGVNLEIFPHAGVSLGNAFTYAAAGGTVRIGSHLRQDSGAPRTRMIMSGTNFPRPGDYFVWNLFAGLEYRLMGYNIFIDGNTYSDTSQVEPKALVHDFQMGLELGWGAYRLSLMNVFRSKEYNGQEDGDQFMRLGLSAAF